MDDFFRIESISLVHKMLGLENPTHPLITVIDASATSGRELPEIRGKVLNGLYLVSLKNGSECEILYGRKSYDFQEGTVIFLSPGQVITPVGEGKRSEGEAGFGWTLMFHPNLIRKSGLAKKIREYTFFSYEVHEALHVSESEREELGTVLDLIKKEYNRNIDAYSEELLISGLELLFNYFQRFYGRQFLTRSGGHADVLARFEEFLSEYFSGKEPEPRKLPTVRYCAGQMGYSPNYFSDLLKRETGRTAQEHIQERMIERAKDLLLGTGEPVNRIAFSLGFEYAQHFSKLFKSKTGHTPVEFRKSCEPGRREG